MSALFLVLAFVLYNWFTWTCILFINNSYNQILLQVCDKYVLYLKLKHALVFDSDG
jgi:hypothetical protein